MTSGRTRETVAVLRDEQSLIATVDALLISGFEIADISVLAGRRSVERKFGGMYEHVSDLTDHPDAPVGNYVDEPSRTQAKAAIVASLLYIGTVGTAAMVFAFGGTLTAAVTGAIVVGGVGVFIGCAIVMRLNRHHTTHVDQQIARGGLPVWVQTADHRSEHQAHRILRAQAARGVRVRDIAVARPELALRTGPRTRLKQLDIAHLDERTNRE